MLGASLVDKKRNNWLQNTEEENCVTEVKLNRTHSKSKLEQMKDKLTVVVTMLTEEAEDRPQMGGETTSKSRADAIRETLN